MAQRVLRKKPPTQLDRVIREQKRLVPKLKDAKAEAKDAKDRVALAKATDRLEAEAKATRAGLKKGESLGSKVVKAVVHNVTADRTPSLPIPDDIVKKTEQKAKTDPKTRAWIREHPDWRDGPKMATSELQAPVLKALEQTVRPARAVAGLVDEGPKGFKKGLIENKPYSFGKVLKKKGVPAGVAGAVGFGLDVALDPTTYVTAGTGSIARKSALKAGEQAAAKAAKKGMSEAGQATVRKAAQKRAVAKAPAGSGITVDFAGKQVPGVTRATAAVGRGVSKAAAKAPGKVKSAGAGTKDVFRDVRPQLRPADTPKAQFDEIRQAGRKARATSRIRGYEAEQRGRGLADRLSKDDHENVIHAIETRTIKKLPGNPNDAGTLAGVARAMRDDFRHDKRLKRQAGVPEGTIKNYFPHVRADKLAGGESTFTSGTTVAGKKRTIKKTLKQANEDTPGLFSTNIPQVVNAHGRRTARLTATAQLARDLAKAGEPIKKGAAVRPLKSGESVYHVGSHDGRFGLREVPADQAGKRNGQYVILNKRLVDQQKAGITAPEPVAVLRAFDKAQGGFKRVATATPAFHARNFVGDTQMAYLAQPARKMPGTTKAAGKALRRLSEKERAQRTALGKVPASGMTVKVAGKQQHVDEFLKGAREHGVVRSGLWGREFDELSGKTAGAGKVRGRRVLPKGASFKRWLQNREDLMRLATYKHGLDKGMSESQAADLSLNAHIDYGDLSQFERRVARRAAPFYTFSSRALPIHAKALVQKPGKFATIQKARDAASLATGTNLQEDEKHLKEYQARQAPFILKIGGKKHVISDALPLTLLNEVPTSANAGAYIDELSKWMGSLASPILKNPVELYSNRSLFFRSDIENKDRPLVSAPGWAGELYKKNPTLAKKLGIVPDFFDKRTGKEVPGWDGKTNYLFKMVPGLPNILQQISSEGSNKRGQTRPQKILGAVAGVRSEPFDPAGAALEVLSKEYTRLGSEIGRLDQRPGYKAKHMGEYRELTGKRKRVEAMMRKLSIERGDKVPIFNRPSSGGPSNSLGGKLGGGVGGGSLGGGF